LILILHLLVVIITAFVFEIGGAFVFMRLAILEPSQHANHRCIEPTYVLISSQGFIDVTG
jgi:hypothetical protein